MEFTEDRVAKIAERLAALPPVQPPARKMTKQEVVTSLREEIEKLLQRGYTLAQIADELRKDGLEIGGPTLKSYLTRARAKERSKRGLRASPKRQLTRAKRAPAKNAGEAVQASKVSGSFQITPDQEDL